MAVIMVIAIADVWIFPRTDEKWAKWIVLGACIIKLLLIIHLSFNQLVKIIGQSHLLGHILVLFGLLIGLIIFSFGTDYTALYLIDKSHFKTNLEENVSVARVIFEYMYMSTITFSSVGYGDIVPMTFVAKFIVMLEVVLQFFVLVFGIANINQIRVNQN